MTNPDNVDLDSPIPYRVALTPLETELVGLAHAISVHGRTCHDEASRATLAAVNHALGRLMMHVALAEKTPFLSLLDEAHK